MDDDVEIVDVNEDGDVVEIQRSHGSLQNPDLPTQLVRDILVQYGWFLILLVVGVILLLQHLSKRRSTQAPNHSTPEVTQDTATVVRRQEGLEAARRRMQEELDAKALLFKERQQQLEEEKRRQKIEMWDSMKDGKSCKGNSTEPENSEGPGPSTGRPKPKTDKKTLRGSDYSPLGGGGGSCTWRPGRRGPSAGG